MAMWPNLRNYLALQLVWLAAVAGAGRGLWWAGPAALAVFPPCILACTGTCAVTRCSCWRPCCWDC